jgi:membrane associated rhomboid family serine protease
MAFFQEAKPAREPFLNAPASVLVLIGVILVAHTARVLSSGAVSEQLLENYALIPARYVASAWAAAGGGPVSFLDGVLPFFGYMFLHADFVHVGVNCLWLLVAGTPVARRLGTTRFLGLFIVTGLIAGAVFLAANWGTVGAAIGASGAVSGMMGAAIRIFYGQRMGEAVAVVDTRPLAPLFGGPVLFFSAIWCVANVVAGVAGLGATGAVQAIAWEAHLGGYFAGLLLIGPFDAWRRAHTSVA